MKQQRNNHNEHGQSVVLVALGLAVLMAFMALAVDGGNVYAQRRQAQNAADAAAYAGGERLAFPQDPDGAGSEPPRRATNREVMVEILKYAQRNGINVTTSDNCTGDFDCVSATYIVRNSDNTTSVHPDPITTTNGGADSVAPLTLDGKPVIGVNVSIERKKFNSFFAPIIGIRTMTVGAPSKGFGAPIALTAPERATPPITTNGTCCSDGLFPVTIPEITFSDENGDGNRDIHFEETDPDYNYILWERDLLAPGNFGYLMWRNQNSSAPTLEANMDDPSRSGIYYVNDWVSGSTGVSNSSGVRTEWQQRVVEPANSSDPDRYVIIPIHDQVTGTGNNTKYHIVGFAKFKVTGYCVWPTNSSRGECSVPITNNSNRYIQGKFQQWVTSRCEGSCPNYGITTTKLRPPLDQTRSLIGIVKINKLIPSGTVNTTKTPVDVVHVLDISGSMNYCFGTTTDCSNTNANQKLRIAKNALISFNNVLSTTLGDKAGLATFPKIQPGSQYNYTCEQNGRTSNYYHGQNRQNLTSEITTLNTTIDGLSAIGGTPIAGGLLVGRGMFNANSTNIPVIILASDGIANIRTNGQWTGFSGSTYNNLTCNNPAVQDAITEANNAKSDNDGDGKPDAIIFTIAIGSDFNSDALRSIATEPADTHFYQVTSGAAMQQIYDSIADRLVTSTECLVTQKESFAPNAVVRVRNRDTGATLQTTTTSAGYFAFTNIQPGLYEFTSASVTVSGMTYDIFTDGVGGPVMTSNPTIQVGDGSGVYEQDIALKTDDYSCSAP